MQTPSTPPPGAWDAITGRELLFDAVIFDLDGTLVATDRFWVAAANVGARRAFAELGIERELPSPVEWMSMVGLALERAFDLVFSDLDPSARAHVMRRCVEEEESALRGGGAALLPGVLETLRELSRRGIRMGIASNCGAGYLAHMRTALPLGEWIAEGRCLDSPGIASKAEMIADLLTTFGTRSAVMVGDRHTDADAAHANGLPHVHLSQGFAPPGERVEAQAVLTSLWELVPRLCARARWIEGALRSLNVVRDGAAVRGGVSSLGVTGIAAAGKTLFARDLARVVERAGRAARVVALDAYARGGDDGRDESPLEHVARRYDVERLIADLLEPHRAGKPARLPDGGILAPEDLLVVEGPFLLHPRLRLGLDRVLHLDVDPSLAFGRIAARDGGQVLAGLRRGSLRAQLAWLEALPPVQRADLCLDASNPLGPPDS